MSQRAVNRRAGREPVRSLYLDRCVVTAKQMQAIESRVFDAGMPVAALMEKVAGLVARRIQELYPLHRYPRVLILVGPGHNGGDALVVARELHEQGYEVMRCQPISKLKPLTQAHSDYADHLGLEQMTPEQLQAQSSDESGLPDWDVIIDGLFGFGLTRPLEGAIATTVNILNAHPAPIVSIDLPSGLDTDTGSILGTAIGATYTLCLGLWKRSLLQDRALAVAGQAELIDFGLPLPDIQAVLGEAPSCQRLTDAVALASLPLPRQPDTYKYREGHLLLVCGSAHYMGAALLAARAARASGVGMLSVAVPETLKPILVSQLADALVIACPEDYTGAIAHFPNDLDPQGFDLSRYDAVACGPGMTLQAQPLVKQLIESNLPLVLDADGLNSLAQLGAIATLKQRQMLTLLTPHIGEFRRLFPDLEAGGDRLALAQTAAEQSQAVIILKGARTIIAAPDGRIWVNPHSTPALARGGSGDVLTGLMAGVLTQHLTHHRHQSTHPQSTHPQSTNHAAIDWGVAASRAAVWWHAQGAIAACQTHTELGVDASLLIDVLGPTLRDFL